MYCSCKIIELTNCCELNWMEFIFATGLFGNIVKATVSVGSRLDVISQSHLDWITQVVFVSQSAARALIKPSSLFSLTRVATLAVFHLLLTTYYPKHPGMSRSGPYASTGTVRWFLRMCWSCDLVCVLLQAPTIIKTQHFNLKSLWAHEDMDIVFFFYISFVYWASQCSLMCIFLGKVFIHLNITFVSAAALVF